MFQYHSKFPARTPCDYRLLSTGHHANLLHGGAKRDFDSLVLAAASPVFFAARDTPRSLSKPSAQASAIAAPAFELLSRVHMRAKKAAPDSGLLNFEFNRRSVIAKELSVAKSATVATLWLLNDNRYENRLGLRCKYRAVLNIGLRGWSRGRCRSWNVNRWQLNRRQLNRWQWWALDWSCVNRSRWRHGYWS